MLNVTVNDEKMEFSEGLSILQALKIRGIQVPTLCYDERLKPYGGCRLCIVDVKGLARPVTACNTKLEDGMIIKTHTPEIEDLRRTLLRMLAHRYPLQPFQRFPDKEFHRYLTTYQVQNELLGRSDPNLVDDSNPYIHIDMSQCVYCYRCVRICEEVQGQFAWKIWNRGDLTRIIPDSGTTLMESSCVSCGACVDTCPTGALEDKTVLRDGVPSSWTRTICPYCATGCELNVGKIKERIVEIRPVLDSAVSKGHLCVKGRYAFQFVHSKDRVTEPMIRRNGVWEKVSWEEAIAFVAENLNKFIKQFGPDSVGVLTSSRATNEENYLAQKFARIVLGTNNVDCCARVCHAPSASAMGTVFGTGAATSSFDDIEKARTILVCGANPTENHPIVGARIKQQVLRGAHLIVIDPRKTELTRYGGLHLQLRPGTNVPLLNAMAHVIVEERLYDEQFLAERVSGWDEFREFIHDQTPEKAEAICGVDAKLIREAARIYATEKPTLAFHGLGVTENIQGTEGVMCLANLALLTGNIGKPGAGVNPLRGQNNVQGAAHMGCEPSRLTGFTTLADGKRLFEEVWRAPIPMRRGLNAMEVVDAAGRGEVKAIWVMGWDILLTNPNANQTEKALSSAEFIIVQDLFMNETAQKVATVFLPACSTFEKDGTFMNSERRIQLIREVIQPVGSSRPDWKIICDLAAAMGKKEFFDFNSPKEIWDEIRAVWKAGNGITYSRLEHGGLQWPCPSEDHPGTQILHTSSFTRDKRAELRRIEHRPSEEATSDEFPLLLTTGRSLYQFNAGTMTLRTGNTLIRQVDYLEISPTDATRLGLREGMSVKVMSRHGETSISLKVNPAIKEGTLFATFHTPTSFLNRVTGPHRDNYTATPEYKVTAVKVERLNGHDG